MPQKMLNVTPAKGLLYTVLFSGGLNCMNNCIKKLLGFLRVFYCIFVSIFPYFIFFLFSVILYIEILQRNPWEKMQYPEHAVF